MAEENSSTMNFDLNLGPLDNPSDGVVEPGSESYTNVSVALEDLLDGPLHRVREVVRRRGQRWRSLWRQIPIPPETRNLALELVGGDTQQTGEGSVATEEETPNELAKTCENGDGYTEDDGRCKKDDAGKNVVEESSFFDCNICLDLAKDPVVTCCGHLFCWSCLYQWLHHHSDAKECPICKGEVTTKNVTPIYGRGSNNTREPNVNNDLKIPSRPQARRVESLRQSIQRNAASIPMEETIRRLGGTFDLSWELAQIQSQDSRQEALDEERRNLLINRILTSTGIRREHSPEMMSMLHYGVRDDPRSSSPLHRRLDSLRAATLSNLTSAFDYTESLAAERLVESYFHRNPGERTRALPVPYEDRDSLSSIAAAIHSGSQTVDNAVEIDSTVTVSTSSRRRNGGSRVLDINNGDSRAPRRRRLN